MEAAPYEMESFISAFCLPHGRLRDASFSTSPSPPGDICLRAVLLLQFPFHEIPHPYKFTNVVTYFEV